MLKLIDPNDAHRPQPPLPEEVIKNVFKVLHGFYGNLFLSKFATGEVATEKDVENPAEVGGDKGVLSARKIWAFGLRDFDAGTVKAALSQCIDRHAEFPPTMPQFVQLCTANKPREVFKPDQLAIGMSQELRSQYARRAREVIAKHEARATERESGYVKLPQSLDGLKRAIANAAACAGGDEAATLRGLDVMLAPRAAA